MDAHSTEDDNYLQENSLFGTGEQAARAGAGELLATVDLKIAFGFEKLLNLEMLVMDRAADIEPLMRDPQSLSADSVDRAFEFDVLYGIVDSETNELEKLVGSVQMDIANAENEVSVEGPGSRVMDKLHSAADSLTKMQDLISTIRKELATFEKTIPPSHDKQGTGEAMGYGNGHLSTQTEDQRSILQMLQQSIASTLDLEMKLCDSQSIVEDLKMKLHHAEQESGLLEDSIEALYETMFAAENASQFLLGTSKELVGKINAIHLYLSASVGRKYDLKSKLEESLMNLNANQSTRGVAPGDSDTNTTSQEALQTQALSPPEFLTLRNKVQQLEEWLRETGFQPQRSLLSRGTTEDEQSSMTQSGTSIISDIKLAIFNAESRAQKTEARCTQLTQTNVQLNGELNSLKSQGSDRAGLLEMKLKESDTQLEHAKASVDAIVEHQGMLRSSMSDMEQMIEDLKEKYLKAETRAENAESKCSLLTDTNLELSEELSFLRGRVESLENSLHQANQLKVSTAKDIGSKTKTITDLVAKLALERERLHVQIVTLTKKNRILAQKSKENDNGATSLSNIITATEGELMPYEQLEETLNSSATQPKVTPIGKTWQKVVEADEVTPLEDESGARRTPETEWSIERRLMLNWKHISVAALILLASVLVYQLYQFDGRVQQLLRKLLG